MTTPLSRRWEWFLAALILFLAGGLRLGWPGLTEFKADEARLLALAFEMIEERRLALRGISSSVGLPNFPVSVWLYALPLLLWPHVYAATLFTGLLNTLAAAGCYALVRRYWGVGAALAATLMLAVSPWAVIFSRKIWAQNLLPLLVLGWAAGALLALVEKRPKFLLLHFVCLALAVQIHLAAVALIPATAVLLLIFWRRLDWRQVGLGLGLAGATLIPFLLYLARHGEQIGLGRQVVAERGGQFSLDSFRYTIQLSLGQDIHSLAGPTAFQAYLALVPNGTAVQWLWAMLIVGGVITLAWQAWRNWGRPRAEAGLVVLIWLLIPPLFFLWHSTPIYIHYFIATLPAQYIAAGVGLVMLTERITYYVFRKRSYAIRNTQYAIPTFSTTLLLTTAVIQLWLIVGLITFVGERATPGGFGTPLGHLLTTVAEAERLFGETNAAEVLLVGPGDWPELDEFPAVYGLLLRQFPHRFVNVSEGAVFPAQTAVVLLDNRAEGGVGPLYKTAVSRQQTIPLRPGEGVLSVMALPGSSAPAPELRFDEIYLLSNWVNFLGYSGPEPIGDDYDCDHECEYVGWWLSWRTADEPDPRQFHLFTHLLDGSGQRLAQADAPAFRPDQWRAGDVVVSQFLLPWPAEGERPFTIRTGMYHYPSIDPVLLLDVAGNPYADAVEIEVAR
jgi:4-amino-4-deoxy-L-arabinose transferase-like glycosyltransferase